MPSKILYRGGLRLYQGNQEDETVYRFLENLPQRVNKNDVIKEALIEYIHRHSSQAVSKNEGTDIAPVMESIKGLSGQLQDMEGRLLDAIKDIPQITPAGMGEKKPDTPEKPPEIRITETENEIPADALNFVTRLNTQY